MEKKNTEVKPGYWVKINTSVGFLWRIFHENPIRLDIIINLGNCYSVE
jgi:hypothetical protein